MNSYNYTGKNDFDDKFLKHQTKTQFKDRLPTDKDRNNNKRSAFVDCFVGDSIINPRIDCPPGANCIKNRSNFVNGYCRPGTEYYAKNNSCITPRKCDGEEIFIPELNNCINPKAISKEDYGYFNMSYNKEPKQQFNCGPNMAFNNILRQCEPIARPMPTNQKQLQRNRKSAFFNSIVE